MKAAPAVMVFAPVDVNLLAVRPEVPADAVPIIWDEVREEPSRSRFQERPEYEKETEVQEL